MPSYMFIALTNSVEGREDDYNRWYDDQHVHDMLDVPGFLTGQRFRLVGPDGVAWRYLAIYEFDSDDPADTLRQLRQRVATATMVTSDALDTGSALALVAEPLGQRHERKPSPASG